MKYVDFCCIVCGWAEGEVGRGSDGYWILFIKEKVPNKVVEVDLIYVFPKCLKQGRWISWGWVRASAEVSNK